MSQASLPNQKAAQPKGTKNPAMTTLTDSPQKSAVGYHPMTSMNKSVASSGGATTMISINMSEKNNHFQSLKSSIQESTLESKFLKRKVEIGEPYASNTGQNLKQIGKHSAYHYQMSQGNSLQQRFSANCPSSSDLYGAALRGGMPNESGSRYFGKSKFSVNSQQATKNVNSVLSAIREGPSHDGIQGLQPAGHFESFERKDSLGSLRGHQQDSIKLKHKNIQIIEKNQK